MYIFLLAMFLALFTGAAYSPAMAQDRSAPRQAPGPLDSIAGPARDAANQANDSDNANSTGNFETRRALARQIHELRPITEQVSDALDYIAADLSPEDRAMFRQSVMENMDMQSLQDASVAAMAQVFTAPELAAMVEYYTKPESRSIEQKSQEYRKRIDPQIVAAINDSLAQLQASVAQSAPAPAPTRPTQ